MFTRILIPTDGSEAVTPAVEAALNLATTYDATLHVLFIVDQPIAVSGTGEGFTSLDDLLDELEEQGHYAIEDITAEAHAQGVETETTVQRGNPYEDILSYASDNDIDLIVMGTHGRTGVKRALLGSVTERVVRHAKIPVLTVHRDPEE